MIGALLGGAWKWIAGLVTIAGALLVGWFKAKQSGREEVILVKTKKEVENVKVAGEVERKVAVEQPAAVQQRLRDRYSRD